MFEISDIQKKELLKYLMKRPYLEVAQLIGLLVSLKPIKKDNGKGKDKAQ